MNCPDGNAGELQNYCDYVSKQLNVNLDYQKIIKTAPTFNNLQEVDAAVQESLRKKDELLKKLQAHK